MILADKIIENRKKNGWSQEELADKLGVSRQSISKWEGAQSVPDMKRILQLSEIFGVSTDYLLKDEIENPSSRSGGEVFVESDSKEASYKEELLHIVSMEEASAFLEHNKRAANQISLGVMLCILSPVILIALSSLTEGEDYILGEKLAATIGMTVLLGLVGAAITLFLVNGFRGKVYEFLESDAIETAYGVSGMAKSRKDEFAPVFSRNLIIGILLCFLSAVPLVIGSIITDGGSSIYVNGRPMSEDTLVILLVCLLLVVIAIGVKLIVHACIIKEGFDKLLEEGDYTRVDKKATRYDGVYWGIATALYLGWSFVTMRWEFTWILWPVVGVLYAAYHEIMKAIMKSK